MPCQVVERKIGRAGGIKKRTARQREKGRKFGEGSWAVGDVINGGFVLQANALESIYNRSYEEHFAAHPEDLEELIRLAKSLRNPHADLQMPAIMTYLERHGLRLQGSEIVNIGSWRGKASHAISIRLSPLHVSVAGSGSRARKCRSIASSARAANRCGKPTELWSITCGLIR